MAQQVKDTAVEAFDPMTIEAIRTQLAAAKSSRAAPGAWSIVMRVRISNGRRTWAPAIRRLR